MLRLAWQQIPHPLVTDILINSDLDGIVLDLEHSSFNPETIYTCISKCLHVGAKCFVRVANIDHTIRTYLDSGASGIILSTVETIGQVNQMRDLCLYPPAGKRGQGLVRENMWGKNAHLLGNHTPILIGQIESAVGISSLKEIDAAGVFQYYLIGPYDLSASIGFIGEFDNPTYVKMIKKIEEIIPKERLGYHIVNDVKKQYSRYKDYGVVALSIDTLAIINRYSEMEKLINDTSND